MVFTPDCCPGLVCGIWLVDSFQYMKCHLWLTWQIVPNCYQMLVGSNQSMPQHLPFYPLHVFCLEVGWRRWMGCVSHKAPMLNEHCLLMAQRTKSKGPGIFHLAVRNRIFPKLKISSRADVEDVQAEGEAGAATLSSAPKLLTATHCSLFTVQCSVLSALCSPPCTPHWTLFCSALTEWLPWESFSKTECGPICELLHLVDRHTYHPGHCTFKNDCHMHEVAVKSWYCTCKNK